MDPETTPGELRAIQEEILILVHQLDRIHTRLRSLQSHIDPGDDEAMVECTAPPSLAFEVHGGLDLASEQLAQTTEWLRQAGVDTEETVRQQFFRLILKQDVDPESSEPQGS